jgi:hypothetical protein
MTVVSRFALAAVLLLVGCAVKGPPTAPSTQTAMPTPSAGPTQAPTSTLAPSPSVAGGWEHVSNDLLGGTNSLYRSLSADEAVYSISRTCSDSCVHQVLVTNDGREWRTMANSIANADSVQDLAFDDGLYVSVGIAEGAAIWTSLGSLWSLNDQSGIFDAGADGGPVPANHNDARVAINAVGHGDIGWFAGGDVTCLDCLLEPGHLPSRYAAWTSTDGRAWTREPWQSGPGNIVRAASNGSSFATVGFDGVWQTADGQSWQHVVVVDPDTVAMIDVAARDGDYMAVGLDRANGVQIWQSAAGQAWTQTAASVELTNAVPLHLRLLAGRWVLVGTGGSATGSPQMNWSSADGQSWAGQLIATDQKAHVEDVGAIGEQLVAVGSYADGGPTTGAAWVGSLP